MFLALAWSRIFTLAYGYAAANRAQETPQGQERDLAERSRQLLSASDLGRLYEGDTVDEVALKALILEAVGLNTSKVRER